MMCILKTLNDSLFPEKGSARLVRKLVAASGITIRKNSGEKLLTAYGIHFDDIKSTQRY